MVDRFETRHVIRRAALFATSLWGEWLEILSDDQLDSPSLKNGVLYLPAFELSHLDTARAGAIHALAHMRFGSAAPFSTKNYKTRQIKLIEIIEDARVEALLLQQYPGLRRLLLSEIRQSCLNGNTFDRITIELVSGLMQPELNSDNPWVCKGVDLFYGESERWHETGFSVELGLRLAHDLGQMRIPMNEKDYGQIFLYRDDNQHLWAQEQVVAEGTGDSEAVNQAEKQAFMVEAGQGYQIALADNRIAGGDTGLYLISNEAPMLSYLSAKENKDDVNHLYPEWHYQFDRYRNNWCIIEQQTVVPGNAETLEHKLEQKAFVLRQLKRVARNLRLERMQRQRKNKDGDELDLNAALDAFVGIRRGEDISERIYEKSRPVHDGGLATQLLIDISASTDRIINPGETLLDVARQSALMLAMVIDELYEAVAIDGFCSNTRNQVAIYPVKRFEENNIEKVILRMSGLVSHWSTRLGAAIRYKAGALASRSDYHKLMLVISDGEPSDIDVFDKDYLIEDARVAVQEARLQGLLVFCVLLNPAAEESARRIFGMRHLLQVSDVHQLPEQLARMFLKIIRHY